MGTLIVGELKSQFNGILILGELKSQFMGTLILGELKSQFMGTLILGELKWVIVIEGLEYGYCHGCWKKPKPRDRCRADRRRIFTGPTKSVSPLFMALVHNWIDMFDIIYDIQYHINIYIN